MIWRPLRQAAAVLSLATYFLATSASALLHDHCHHQHLGLEYKTAEEHDGDDHDHHAAHPDDDCAFCRVAGQPNLLTPTLALPEMVGLVWPVSQAEPHAAPPRTISSPPSRGPPRMTLSA